MKPSKRINRRIRVSFETVKHKSKTVLPFLVLIPIIIVVANIFKIKTINCTFNGSVCPQEIIAVTNNLLGTNSLFVNQKELLTFIKAAYPVDEMNVGYQALNTLNVKLKGTIPYVQADVYLVNTLPALSMDQAPSTTDSAGWWVKPTGEIEDFLSGQKALGFNLWDDGSITSIATTGANISYVFLEKPNSETISSVFKMITLVQKYIAVSNIYIVEHRCFLSRPNEPDIIIGVPFDEGSLAPALQSLSYLATIKKDAKVIDLSFKNPIIR